MFTTIRWEIDGDQFLEHEGYLTDKIYSTRKFNQRGKVFKYIKLQDGIFGKRSHLLQLHGLVLHRNERIHKTRKIQSAH